MNHRKHPILAVLLFLLVLPHASLSRAPAHLHNPPAVSISIRSLSVVP